VDTGSAQLDRKYFLVRRYYKHATSADFWGSFAELYGKVYRISELITVAMQHCRSTATCAL